MTCLKDLFLLPCWIDSPSSSSLLSAEGVVCLDCLFTYLFFLTECLSSCLSLDRLASLLELSVSSRSLGMEDGGIVFGWIIVEEVFGWIRVEDFGWIGSEGFGWIGVEGFGWIEVGGKSGISTLSASSGFQYWSASRSSPTSQMPSASSLLECDTFSSLTGRLVSKSDRIPPMRALVSFLEILFLLASLTNL